VGGTRGPRSSPRQKGAPTSPRGTVTLFLAGDVMPGRGVDQIFARSCPPRLYERFVSSALTYVELAERKHGPIPRPADPAYVWGDALAELDRVRPDARIANLETSVTTSEDHAPLKGIHYRMHPANVEVLSAAELDCVALANNHVLDWGESGLVETLECLEIAGIRTAGAGRDPVSTRAPTVLDHPGRGRIVVVAVCFPDSGVPLHWTAGPDRPGVHVLPDYSEESASAVAGVVEAARRSGDLVVASLHWGSNWGYGIPAAHRRFARLLIERAGVDLVHGHSSHHPRAIEVVHDRLVLYGCGDFLNDYEGIRGHEKFRGDLALMYFPGFDTATGELVGLEIVPLRTRRFRLERPPRDDLEWLRDTLDRECRRFGGEISLTPGGRLELS